MTCAGRRVEEIFKDLSVAVPCRTMASFAQSWILRTARFKSQLGALQNDDELLCRL